MLRRSEPSAWMRSCTDFCAPLPSATMVIMAPTPMMMPSMVRKERRAWARIACSATRRISTKSMRLASTSFGVVRLGPLPGAGAPRSLRCLRAGVRAARLPLRLLLQPRQPTPRHALEALTEVALLREQRGARQYEHRVALRQARQHLDVIEVGEPRADLHRRGLPRAQGEDDEAPAGVGVPRAAPPAPPRLPAH